MRYGSKTTEQLQNQLGFYKDNAKDHERAEISILSANQKTCIIKKEIKEKRKKNDASWNNDG